MESLALGNGETDGETGGIPDLVTHPKEIPSGRSGMGSLEKTQNSRIMAILSSEKSQFANPPRRESFGPLERDPPRESRPMPKASLWGRDALRYGPLGQTIL